MSGLSAVGALWQFGKVEVQVKAPCVVVDRIDNNGHSANLRGLAVCPVQGIHEEKLSESPTPLCLIDGEPPKERRRQQRIAGKFLATASGSSPASMPNAASVYR